MNEAFIKAHGYGRLGTFALIVVSDTGSGMDAATRERLFEPFFTTKEVGKGTGLGLSIVYGIIKQHEGYINVYSEPGKGAAFRIYLPIAGATAEGRGLSTVQPPRGGSETLLVAEDEPDVRRFIKALLEEFGYTVIEASNGEDAVEKYMSNKDAIRLLILDVIMPKKNGKEVFDGISAINPGVKALFTSGYNEDIIHKKGVLEEGLNFISKPFVPSEFLRTVRRLLDE